MKPPVPLLLDLSHTSHTRALTGIQRVARCLWRELGPEARPICWDPWERAWRALEGAERLPLEPGQPAAPGRGASWPLSARLRGRLRRLSGGAEARRAAAFPDRGAAVLVPEIFSPEVAAALPSLFAATTGPRVALFHDAIPLRLPELTPTATVARFPAYLLELLAFDGIAANSQDSADSLLDYWRWSGAARHPQVKVFPFGLDLPPSRTATAPPFSPFPAQRPSPETPPAPAPDRPVILSVGSLEGRKNHMALLKACEFLWSMNLTFELHLIGLAHPGTAGEALALISDLQRAGRPLRYDGPVGDDALEAAYARCSFTVYPSLCEGFGLPIAESLLHGRPCVCLGTGAIGETARGGGCLTLDQVDSTALIGAIGHLLSSAEQRTALTVAARQRRFPSWNEYTTGLVDWMGTLRR